MRDLHAALRTEKVSEEQREGVEFVLVRLQDGKDDVRFSLHACPSQFSSWGPQTTDLLAQLGFRRSPCRFVHGDECFVHAAVSEFDVPAFAEAFSGAFKNLCEADRRLSACGLFLPLDEGLGFFLGRPSTSRRRPVGPFHADGHKAQTVERRKESEDESFRYVLTWMVDSSGKGWTIHHRPQHPPISPEVSAAFRMLGLKEFSTCPEFEFEPCWWRHLPGMLREGDPFVTNAEEAHRIFDALPTHFAPGIEHLLAANGAIRPFGMSILPAPAQPASPQPHGADSGASARPSSIGSLPEHFDVAISFAGPQRQLAERLATLVREAGFSVFYDDFYPEHLWGMDLPVLFDDIFRKRSRFCVIFASTEYVERMWTNHERQAAVARALDQRGRAYILPIRVDEVELPGVPPTLGYVSLRERPIEGVGEILVRKLSLEASGGGR